MSWHYSRDSRPSLSPGSALLGPIQAGSQRQSSMNIELEEHSLDVPPRGIHGYREPLRDLTCRHSFLHELHRFHFASCQKSEPGWLERSSRQPIDHYDDDIRPVARIPGYAGDRDGRVRNVDAVGLPLVNGPLDGGQVVSR
jgi:hypothetical protein